MTQKTFKTTSQFQTGDEILLYSKSTDGKETFYASKEFAISGYGGNLNPDIKRFHGWRGNSFGTDTYAYGVRRVIKVENVGEDDMGRTIYKVTVGKDIHPDWA